MSIMSRMSDYSNPDSFGSKMRRKRSERLKQLITEIYRRNAGRRVSIIDLGGEVAYWQAIGFDQLHVLKAHITIVNMHAEKIPENPDPEMFTFAVGDACDLSQFRDLEFDLAHSNSVVEHVGSFRRMGEFARETMRVAPAYYVQTPAFSFPIEPHFGAPFFHWLPEPVRAWIVTRRAMATFPRADSLERAYDFIQDVHLLTYRQFARLFPHAEIRRETLFGLTKSYMAIEDRAASVGVAVPMPIESGDFGMLKAEA